jgi:lysophospholipase L1-like esterase
MKSLLKNLFLSLVSILIILALGEVACRMFLMWKYGAGWSEHAFDITIEPELGWVTRSDYVFSGHMKSLDGSSYPAEVTFDKYGFRVFGDPGSSRPKMLVIGDSFTEALHVSNDKIYYAILGDMLDREIFAYGGSGYATLQEYMVLDRYLDEIEPDVILWQFCNNDIKNNTPELEMASLENNGLLRPYWVNGQIKYVLPKKNAALRKFAIDHSRLLYYIFSRLDRLMPVSNPVDDEIKTQGFRHEGFIESVRVTEELMGMVKKRARDIPIFAFTVNPEEPYSEAFKSVSLRNGIPFFDDVGVELAMAKQRGEVINHEDGGHFNETGNRLLAEALFRHFRDLQEKK